MSGPAALCPIKQELGSLLLAAIKRLMKWRGVDDFWRMATYQSAREVLCSARAVLSTGFLRGWLRSGGRHACFGKDGLAEPRRAG